MASCWQSAAKCLEKGSYAYWQKSSILRFFTPSFIISIWGNFENLNDHAWIRFNFKSWINSILFLLLLFEEALIEWHISQIREFKFQPELLISFLASFEFKGTQDCNCCIGGNLQLLQFWSNWHWSIPKLIVGDSGYNSVKMSRALRPIWVCDVNCKERSTKKAKKKIR